ncbi:MAG: TonB-dependent receptor plug domain-containing protein, partial [Woeseiaceae bacterium]
MKRPPRPVGFALLTSVIAVGTLSPCASIAQDEVDVTIDEIIIVGTRRQGRTAIDTPVPVDVFNEEDLQSVSSPELLEVLQTLVPSFTLARWPTGDGASFIRPPQMRGLDSDKTLLLVNGKRRHRGALVLLGRSGSHGPDLASIPSIALRNIEILRDGASALYGSDAIAGVMNFNLKESAEGGELQAQYGQFTLGDENTYRVAGNIGLPLGDKGFINVSMEWNDAEATSRGTEFGEIRGTGLTPAETALVSGFFDHDGDPSTPDQERFGPDALTEVYVGAELVSIFNGSDGIPDDTDTRYADNLRFAEIGDNVLVQPVGRPEREAFHAVVNAGYDISDTLSLYGWFNYSDSDTNRNSGHRPPGVSRLWLVRTPDGEIYNPRNLYPAGFTPRFFGKVLDQSFTGGMRGEWPNGITYDFGGRYGRSEIRYKSSNTMNPSLGPSTPTEFAPGNLISDEAALTFDFTVPVSIGLADDALLAFGFEYREEGYKSEPGDPASFAGGPYSVDDPWDFETSVDEAAAGENGGVVECRIPGLESIGTPCPALDPIHNALSIGSEGFPGYGPLSVFDYERDSWAVYADIEADITDRFLFTVAGRYEDFSDFGDNFSYRIASRYFLNDKFTIRGSFGTGFRAPTPGQIATINVQGRPGLADPFLLGVFPATHPASQIFGAVPLDAETSTQWTLGLTATPLENLTFTLDYYQIEVDDRISMTSRFFVGPDERLVLVASGAPGADSISAVKFFNNDIDTETNGLDLVATYSVDWAAGITTLSASANWNRTEVTRRTPRPGGFVLDDTDVFNTKNGSPRPRAVLDLRHTWAKDLTLLIRGNWYGSYTIEDSRNPGTFQDFDSLV